MTRLIATILFLATLSTPCRAQSDGHPTLTMVECSGAYMQLDPKKGLAERETALSIAKRYENHRLANPEAAFRFARLLAPYGLSREIRRYDTFVLPGFQEHFRKGRNRIPYAHRRMARDAQARLLASSQTEEEFRVALALTEKLTRSTAALDDGLHAVCTLTALSLCGLDTDSAEKLHEQVLGLVATKSQRATLKMRRRLGARAPVIHPRRVLGDTLRKHKDLRGEVVLGIPFLGEELIDRQQEFGPLLAAKGLEGVKVVALTCLTPPGPERQSCADMKSLKSIRKQSGTDWPVWILGSMKRDRKTKLLDWKRAPTAMRDYRDFRCFIIDREGKLVCGFPTGCSMELAMDVLRATLATPAKEK